MSLAGRHIIHIACSPAYSAAVTNMGEVYIWGGSRSAHSTPSSDNLSVPTLVTALHGLIVVDVACGNADSPILILTSQGEWMRHRTILIGVCCLMIDPKIDLNHIPSRCHSRDGVVYHPKFSL